MIASKGPEKNGFIFRKTSHRSLIMEAKSIKIDHFFAFKVGVLMKMIMMTMTMMPMMTMKTMVKTTKMMMMRYVGVR